jgi:hypothetical protein
MKKPFYILAGSDVSILVLADLLSDSGKNIILVNKFNNWGGIFLGTKINKENFDIGMMNFELMFKKKNKKIKLYDPEKFGDMVYYQEYIRNYLKKYLKFRKILIKPRMFFQQKQYNDLIISDYLNFFDNNNAEMIQEKIKSEAKFCLNKVKYKLNNKHKKFNFFLSNNLEKVILQNCGRTYYVNFIKPIVKKVLSISPKHLPSIFHRNGLAPLYYPETIIKGTNNDSFKQAEFLYPQDKYFGKFITRILDKISKKKNVNIFKNCKNIEIIKKKKSIKLNETLFEYSKIFWSGDITELGKLNNVQFDYNSIKKDKANLLLFFLIIKKKYIKNNFSFIIDVDKDCPIYRITNQSLCSGINQKNYKIIIESNYDMFKSNNLENEVKSYLKKYDIDSKGIVYIEKKYFKNGLLKPSSKGFLHFNLLKKKIKKLTKNVILMGGSLNYNMNTLNDQILQGIKFSGKVK